MYKDGWAHSSKLTPEDRKVMRCTDALIRFLREKDPDILDDIDVNVIYAYEPFASPEYQDNYKDKRTVIGLVKALAEATQESKSTKSSIL